MRRTWQIPARFPAYQWEWAMGEDAAASLPAWGWCHMPVTSRGMRRAVAAGGLTFLLLPGAARAQSATLPLNLLSYNLHHGEGGDGRIDLARIGRIISAVAPGYAGLQEVDSVTARTGRVDQAAEYARLTGLRSAFARAIPLEGGAYGNAVLSRFPLGRLQRIALPGGEPRAALIVDIDLSEGRDPVRSTVTFVNTHLMNATRSSGPIREFLKTWQAADFDYGIDWVCFRPAGRWRFILAAKLDEGDAAVASDHLPVAQEMELLLPPATALQAPLRRAPMAFPRILALPARPFPPGPTGAFPVDPLGRNPPLLRRF